MLGQVSALVLLALSSTNALPMAHRRAVNLDPDATAEAQRRDDTAARVFTGPIKTSTGQCLTIDENTGDFRRNLMAVTAANCDGSPTQQFDVVTAGKHNDQPGQALIVSSSLFNCLNFDPRRQPGNQVLMFSCGGRADGDGRVTDSQLFAFSDPTQTSFALVPQSGKGSVCFSVVDGKLDQSQCDTAEPAADQIFTLGDASPAPPPAPPAQSTELAETTAPVETATSEPPAQQTKPPTQGSVKLDLEATAESHQRDDTATRALSAAPIKVDGKCLAVNLDSGDFRQNLITLQFENCDGSDTQQFDVITAGKHNDRPGTALIVSSLTQGCLNVDERRQPGNQVVLFSCGGRADGEGQVTSSQLFAFNGNAVNVPLVPSNVDNTKCLFNDNGQLGLQNCDPANARGNQLFSIA